jgi:hypothetical protein
MQKTPHYIITISLIVGFALLAPLGVTAQIATPSPTATAKPSPTVRPTPCVSDRTLSGQLNPRLTEVSQKVRADLGNSRDKLQVIVDDATTSIKKDAGENGGRFRDIYSSNADARDMKQQIEEHFLKLSEAQLLAAASGYNKPRLDAAAGRFTALDAAFSRKDYRFGTFTRSRSVGMQSMFVTKSGDFRMRIRQNLGTMQEIGRINFTITLTNRIGLSQPIKVKSTYNNCATRGDLFANTEYSATAVATTATKITYRAYPSGAGAKGRKNVSGSIIITDTNDAIEREIEKTANF